VKWASREGAYWITATWGRVQVVNIRYVCVKGHVRNEEVVCTHFLVAVVSDAVVPVCGAV
jgi:hypothetical protein